MSLHDLRPPKAAPTKYLTIDELREGEYYTCRLSGKTVRVCAKKDNGATMDIYIEGLGFRQYTVKRHQLY